VDIWFDLSFGRWPNKNRYKYNIIPMGNPSYTSSSSSFPSTTINLSNIELYTRWAYPSFVGYVCNGGDGGGVVVAEVVPYGKEVCITIGITLLYNSVTHPLAISRLLMSFLIFHISTLRSEVVSSPLVVISGEYEEYS